MVPGITPDRCQPRWTGKRQQRVLTDQEESEVWYPGQPAPDNQCQTQPIARYHPAMSVLTESSRKEAQARRLVGILPDG